jgi:hypothetical protein
MAYQAVVGWDHIDALEDLASQPLELLDPRTPSIKPARIRTALDGHAVADGVVQAALVYDAYLTTTRLRALLEQLGLRNDAAEIESAEVTLCLPGQDRDWEYWNAVVYHPHPDYQKGRFGETTFPLALVEYLPRQFTSEFTEEFE